MSQDDRTGPASPRERDADWPDEGLIHEWLDGQLDATTAAEVDALVASSPAFAARVAEARGLTAASSRILQSLDAVPGAVVPAAASGRATAPMEVVPTAAKARAKAPASRAGARAGWSWPRIGSIAALLMVGVTGVAVLQREPDATAPLSSVAASDREASSAVDASASESGMPMSAAMDAAPGGAAADQTASAREATASAPEAKAAPAAALRAAPASPVPASAAQKATSADAERANAVVAAASGAGMIGAPAAAAAPMPANVRRTLVNSAGAERERSAAPATMTAFADAVSDVAPEDLLLAVQRVACAPACRQLRVEAARDGRLRRWVQTGFLAGSPETGRVDDAVVTRLERLVDSLELAALPANVQLDGGRCRSVGALRESLRVEFRQDGAVRAVMGLPWCTDGTHAMDRAAEAVEALANGLFGAP